MNNDKDSMIFISVVLVCFIFCMLGYKLGSPTIEEVDGYQVMEFENQKYKMIKITYRVEESK